MVNYDSSTEVEFGIVKTMNHCLAFIVVETCRPRLFSTLNPSLFVGVNLETVTDCLYSLIVLTDVKHIKTNKKSWLQDLNETNVVMFPLHQLLNWTLACLCKSMTLKIIMITLEVWVISILLSAMVLFISELHFMVSTTFLYRSGTLN
jgi:hypothetical protein